MKLQCLEGGNTAQYTYEKTLIMVLYYCIHRYLFDENVKMIEYEKTRKHKKNIFK